MTVVEAVPQARPNRSQRAVLSATAAEGVSEDALAVLAAVPGWWRNRCVDAGIPLDEVRSLEEALAAPAPFPAEAYEQIRTRDDLNDVSPEELADAYVTALDGKVRTSDGRHYTPAPLAQALYDQAVAVLKRPPEGLVWDPACGAGMLLLPALRDWLRRHTDCGPGEVIEKSRTVVGGRDLDVAAVWLGNVLLAAELLPMWAKIDATARTALPTLLSVGDGLQAPPTSPQLALLNPPYGRVRLDERDRERWSHVLFGHANRYGLFMGAMAEYLAPDGAMSALVPAGWLGGSYFQRLRSFLASSAPLKRLTYVGGRSGVFSTGVLQETVLATFKSGASHGAVVCGRVTLNGKTVSTAIGRGHLRRPVDGPWLLPRTEEDVSLISAAQGMKYRLADYGWSVSTGPLVWNRHKSQLSDHPAGNAVKIIWAADLDGGVLHQDPSRDELRYLTLRERDERVLVLDRPAVLVQRTTAPEQPRRLLATALDSRSLASWGGRVSVENHVNVLTADPQLALAPAKLSPRLLTALLSSEAADRLYRCLTGSVAVSAYELSALPLPPPKTIALLGEVADELLQKEIACVYGLVL
ncbi:hypothetical protein [Actinomadura sp. 3N407]|uniref:hypothetical protein n=1 Tax=Actinomadura sp. 3N407 TaxID=3457423 RepID=UPI003FCC66D6